MLNAKIKCKILGEDHKNANEFTSALKNTIVESSEVIIRTVLKHFNAKN